MQQIPNGCSLGDRDVLDTNETETNTGKQRRPPGISPQSELSVLLESQLLL